MTPKSDLGTFGRALLEIGRSLPLRLVGMSPNWADVHEALPEDILNAR